MDDTAGTGPLLGSDDEMSRVMDTHDWSGSPIGPPDTWPPLLRTMVGIMVTSRFSMWMGWGSELTFLYNQAYARDTLGVKHPWALGRPARDVWPEIWDDLEPRVRAVLDEGRATWDEALLLFLERSGYREETYHTFSYSPIGEAGGPTVGMLCVVTEETKRVIAERRMATLRDLGSALSGARTEAEVFAAAGRRLAENRWDLPFTLTYMFGDDGTARRMSSSGFDDRHPAAPESIVVASGEGPWPIGEVLGTGRPVVMDRPPATPRLPSGEWDEPPARVMLVPLSEGGQADPIGVFVAGLNPYRAVDSDYRGFTELLASGIASGVASARAYEAERRRAESLAELDRAKTEFFSNVSHEFRTPLTLILAPADDALNDDLSPLDPMQRGRLEVIQRNARRLRRLVNDMLDFARIEGGRLQAETVPTDLVALTRDIAMSFAPVIERSGLELALDLRPVDRPVHIDRDMWEKILLNLLSNALKFTLEGRIAVSLDADDDGVQLVVSDTGVGIPQSAQPRLFERFYRAPRTAARSHEGTGIGLALVAELARLHGGSVSVASEEGAGSSFRVYVPYGSGSGAVAAQQRDSSLLAYLDEAFQWVGVGGADSSDPVGAHRVVGATSDAAVLVVDDNPDMRSYLERLLVPFWRVKVAADGVEALDLIRAEPPDLVLTDVMMPHLDGFGLLAAMRSDPATATVPVVFLSARAGEEAAVEGLEAGADDYLVKPFSGLELLARVRSNLELSALRNREAAWRAALVDSLEDAVVVLDPVGQVIEANTAFERILGYPRPGAPYSAPYPWVPAPAEDPEAARLAADVLRRSLAGEPVSEVLTLRHRLGHKVHVAAAANVVGDGDDRRIVVAFHDVTAELAASERDLALARLGIRLAEASEVREVHEAGLSELRRAFAARRAAVVALVATGIEERASAGEGSLPGTDMVHEVMAVMRDEPSALVRVSGADEPAPAAGMAAPLDPRDRHTAVWLDFETPRSITLEERSLFTILCAYFGQAIRRAQLFDDNRAVATAMQRSILGPTAVPASIAVRYLPAVRPLEVGGDWYDVIELDEHRLAIVVGDCTGRGLEAATTMGQLRSACRALLLQVKRPAHVLAALDVFAERLPGALCTTVFCGVLDAAAGTLRYSSAGHLPGLVAAPGGGVTRLDQAQGIPLGYLTAAERREAVLTLEPGTTVVLYTDGLVERRGESLEEGIGRLGAAVTEVAAHGPDAVADGLLRVLVPEDDHDDDIALLVYRHTERDGGETIGFPLHADPTELAEGRRRIRAWLGSSGLDEGRANEVLIAAGEALANAIEHAHGFDGDAVIDVSGRIDGETVDLKIVDHGAWKEPSTAENRGRGLEIMRALSDRLEVDRGPGGTTVRIVRRLHP